MNNLQRIQMPRKWREGEARKTKNATGGLREDSSRGRNRSRDR